MVSRSSILHRVAQGREQNLFDWISASAATRVTQIGKRIDDAMASLVPAKNQSKPELATVNNRAGLYLRACSCRSPAAGIGKVLK
jgi:hypothetical protein